MRDRPKPIRQSNLPCAPRHRVRLPPELSLTALRKSGGRTKRPLSPAGEKACPLYPPKAGTPPIPSRPVARHAFFPSARAQAQAVSRSLRPETTQTGMSDGPCSYGRRPGDGRDFCGKSRENSLFYCFLCISFPMVTARPMAKTAPKRLFSGVKSCFSRVFPGTRRLRVPSVPQFPVAVPNRRLSPAVPAAPRPRLRPVRDARTAPHRRSASPAPCRPRSLPPRLPPAAGIAPPPDR